MKSIYSTFFLAVLALAPSAFAQTTYTYVSVDYPGAAYTQLNGINSAGDIVGTSGTDNGVPLESFARTADGSFSQILPDKPLTTAGISDSGVIVGYMNNYGVIISKGKVTPFSPTKYITFFNAISTNNAIVGMFYDGLQEYDGFELLGGKLTPLPLYEGQGLEPKGINSAGTIVGFPRANVLQGFILLAGGNYQTVLYPGANDGTNLTAINDAGVSAGLQYTASLYAQGFTYNGTTFSNVVYPGSVTTMPSGINNSGVVVGTYWDASFGIHGFIATPER